MPLINTFSTVDRAQIITTGNTLGLAGNLTGGPNTEGSIGAFTTTNLALQVPGGWPPGTTQIWQQNSSTAQVNIPLGATVLYAELVWGGTLTNRDQDTSASVNNAVNFITPAGANAVAPDPATQLIFIDTGNGNTTYVNSQDVTALVQAGGSGTYETGAVPGALGNSVFNVAPANELGWVLRVVYSEPSLPIRSIDLWVNDALVNAQNPITDIPVTGFQTPATGPVNAKLFLAAMEGDANIVGDYVEFGPDTANLTNIGNPVTTPNPNPGTSPNNPSNNFFASQINNINGLLDTTGSFGTSNQDDFGGINIPAARQGWDITSVDVSALMQNNQTAAVIRLGTVGDAYINNAVAIQIDGIEPEFSPIKTVDKAFAEVGDIITYTVTFTNTGTAPADNVVLTDLIPQGGSFVPTTVIVDGIPQVGENPEGGIDIGTVAVGQSVTVTYQVQIDSLPPTPPTPAQLVNDADIDYTFEPVVGTTLTGTDTTTEATTQVIEANLNVTKSVDPAFADIGDTITYSFIIENTGNVTATNVVLTDPIPNDTTFVLGSVLVNGAPTGDNPATGINIPDILAGGSATVSFQVTVDAIPSPNPIPDTASIDFEYTVDPAEPPVSGTGDSNTVTTQVNHADLIGPNGENFVKSADKDFVEVGDEVTYTYTITNTGNVAATNIILVDPLPSAVSFIAGSTRVNGLPSADNPVTGIDVPNIIPGATATVSFRVLVNEIPVPNPMVNIGSLSYEYTVDPAEPPATGGGNSNEVEVKVEVVDLQIVKSVDKSDALPGEEVTYTSVISNNGTVTAQNVLFKDSIPAGTTFVPDSVTVNGVPRIGANPSVGVNVGNIAPAGFVTVTFKVTINDPSTVSQIINQSSIDYQVQIDPNGPIDNRTEESNETTVNVQRGELTVVKTVDQQITNIGSNLTYTIVVTNTGTVPVQNIVLTDVIPEGAVFVQNSVSVNGVQMPGANPSVGIPLGSLVVGGQVVITFEVLVETIPCPPELINEAVVNFQFNLPNRTETFTGTSTSNEISTDVELKIFKQISVDENLEIPSQKPDAEDVLDAVVSVEVTRIEIIKTPVGESYEGQTLTGWKAIVYGKLKQKVKYVADEPTQSVHAAHFDIPFTTFLVLPSDYKKCCKIRIEGTVEDVYVQLLDKRTIFKNVTLLIEGKTCS